MIETNRYWDKIKAARQLQLDGSENAVKALRACNAKGVEPTDSDAEKALAPLFKAMGLDASVAPPWGEPLDLSLPRQELKHIHDRIESALRAIEKSPDGLLLAGQRSVRVAQLVDDAIHWTKLIRRRETESEDVYPEHVEWSEEDAG